jgi:hypothetical protein
MRTSDGWTDAGLRNCLFLLVVFLVRIWRLCDCPHLKPPLPVRAKRLAAPRLVFIFGICFHSNKLNKIPENNPTRQNAWPWRINDSKTACCFGNPSVVAVSLRFKETSLMKLILLKH